MRLASQCKNKRANEGYERARTIESWTLPQRQVADASASSPRLLKPSLALWVKSGKMGFDLSASATAGTALVCLSDDMMVVVEVVQLLGLSVL